MINISYKTNRSLRSINHEFKPQIAEIRKNWANQVFTKQKELKLPLEVALDERLSVNDKFLASIFYTLKASNLGNVNFVVFFEPNGMPVERFAPTIRKLKKYGYLRTYRHSKGTGYRTVYEWIGPNTEVMVDNKKFDKKLSTEVVNKFL